MVELDHRFETGKDTDYNWDAILDLDRIIPCVEGGKVLEREPDEQAKAEIKVKMGAMSMTFRARSRSSSGTTTRTRRCCRSSPATPAARATRTPTSRSRSTTAAATIHTAAQINGKAASMGEGVVQSVLDALIKDFTTKLATI